MIKQSEKFQSFLGCVNELREVALKNNNEIIIIYMGLARNKYAMVKNVYVSSLKRPVKTVLLQPL